MAFHVGQKVVCVDNTGAHKWGMKNGSIYTISDMGLFLYSGMLYDLYEIKTHIPHAWGGWRFRPIQENRKSTETGMTILRGILNGAPVKEDA